MGAIGICRQIDLSDVRMDTQRNNVDCMTNPPDIIVMQHIPTGTTVFCELRRDSSAFYRGYLLAYLEQALQRAGGGE